MKTSRYSGPTHEVYRCWIGKCGIFTCDPMTKKEATKYAKENKVSGPYSPGEIARLFNEMRRSLGPTYNTIFKDWRNSMEDFAAKKGPQCLYCGGYHDFRYDEMECGELNS